MKIPWMNYNPKKLIPDLIAGATTALVTIPDGLASAILAGVNPVHGLYGLMVGDALGGYFGTEQQVITLATLTVLVGLFQYL